MQALYTSICVFIFQLSPSFTPTSVIRKMYETKEKSRDEPGGRQDSKDEAERSQDGIHT